MKKGAGLMTHLPRTTSNNQEYNMQKDITMLVIDKIFNILRIRYTNSGFLFKGGNISELEDTWKSQLYKLMKNGKPFDVKSVYDKASTFVSLSNEVFPSYAEFYFYLINESWPSKNWLMSVVSQIKSNELYNRNNGISIEHRNKSAPDSHWELAERIAKHADLNFAQFDSAFASSNLLSAIADAANYLAHEEPRLTSYLILVSGRLCLLPVIRESRLLSK